MQKVTIFTTEFKPYPGGIATYCDEISKELARSGYDVEVCVFGNYGPVPNVDARRKVTILQEPPFSLKRLPRMGLDTWRHAASDAASLLIAADYRCITAIGLLPLKQRKIAVLHGTEVRGRLLQSLNGLRVYRPLAHFDRVITNSEFTRELAIQHHNYLKRDRVIAAPLGIDEDWFSAAPETDRHAIREELSVARDRTLLLSVGRIEPRKGLEFAVRAVNALPAPLKSKVTYLIAGKVLDEAYAARLDDEVRLGDSDIRRLGVVSFDTLKRLYSGADVFLHTAVPDARGVEGFGLVLLEAAAIGLPVVSTRTDAIPEVVKEGVTGFLAEPRDVGAISAAISRLVQDSGLRQSIGAAAPEHARTYSWRSHVSKLIAHASH